MPRWSGKRQKIQPPEPKGRWARVEPRWRTRWRTMTGLLPLMRLVRRLDEGRPANRSGLSRNLSQQSRLCLASRDALFVARRMQRDVKGCAESRLHTDDARLLTLGFDLK